MSDENLSALDGRMQVVNNGKTWAVICDGTGTFYCNDRADATHIFQLMLRAHELGRAGAFHELRQLIGAQ